MATGDPPTYWTNYFLQPTQPTYGQSPVEALLKLQEAIRALGTQPETPCAPPKQMLDGWRERVSPELAEAAGVAVTKEVCICMGGRSRFCRAKHWEAE